MFKYSKKYLLKVSNKLLLFASIATFLLLGFNAYLVYGAPEDYLQGVYAKIMYIHVPSAWLSLFFYSTIAIMSLVFLIWRLPSCDIIAAALAPIGMMFAFITLVTGSIWGKPTWGAWWVWDARLTAMLILLFIYLGYLGLRNSGENSEKLAKVCAIFAVVGFLNIPVIKFSVDLWNTLHQPSSVFRIGGPKIHSSMLWPLISCLLNLLLFSFILFLFSVKITFYGKKLERLKYYK